MSGLWKRNDRVYKGTSVSVGANASDEQVSGIFRITPGGALNGFRVDIVASSVTNTTGLTAKVQQLVGDSYEDVSGLSVAITGNDTFTILMNGRDSGAGYFSELPLGNSGKIVLSTGAGDAATIDNVYITMED